MVNVIPVSSKEELARVASPSAGSLAYVQDSNEDYVYYDGGWELFDEVADQLPHEWRTEVKRERYVRYLMVREGRPAEEAERLATTRLPGVLDPEPAQPSETAQLILQIQNEHPEQKERRKALTRALIRLGFAGPVAGRVAQQHFPDEGKDAGMVVA